MTGPSGSRSLRLPCAGREDCATVGLTFGATDSTVLVAHKAGIWSTNALRMDKWTELPVRGQVTSCVSLDSGGIAYGVTREGVGSVVVQPARDPAREVEVGTAWGVLVATNRVDTVYTAAVALMVHFEQAVSAWRTEDLSLRWKVSTAPSTPFQLVPSPCGRMLAIVVARRQLTTDPNILIVDSNSGRLLTEVVIPGVNQGATTCAFSHDSRGLLYFQSDGSLHSIALEPPVR